jgi:hypothetical protein
VQDDTGSCGSVQISWAERRLAGGGTELVLVHSDRAANLARHRALTEAVAVAVGG